MYTYVSNANQFHKKYNTETIANDRQFQRNFSTMLMCKNASMKLVCCLAVALLSLQIEKGDCQFTETDNHIIPSCVFGVDSVSWYLYNRDNASGFVLPLNDTKPRLRGKSIVFLVHGFTSEANNTNYKYLINIWLQKKDVNIFSLDWANAACNNGISFFNTLAYGSAINNARPVANMMGKYIIELCESNEIAIESLIVVGHSLGAHVAGFSGKYVYNQTGTKYGQLFGLDTAGPLFRLSDCSDRFCCTDADFVAAIHTTIGFGIYRPIGHDDFYFNAGTSQPGCNLDISCSHSRSVEYFANSLIAPYYIGTRWKPGQNQALPISKCTASSCAVAGISAIEYGARGTFNVRVGQRHPYATPKWMEFNIKPQAEKYPVSCN